MNSRSSQSSTARTLCRTVLILFLLLLGPASAQAQEWTWTIERVASTGRFTSLATDPEGNLHISYVANEDELRYGFRPAGSNRWFTMRVDRAYAYTDLALDSEGNPHICYTVVMGAGRDDLKYARLENNKWVTQTIAPASGINSYTCSIAVGPDGTPHVAFFHEKLPDQTILAQLRYAVLKDSEWLVRTLDFDRSTGKWNSLQVDSKGNPHIAYSSYDRGQAKYASWDGKNWTTSTISGRTPAVPQGMGNSLYLDAQGNEYMTYFDQLNLRLARRQGDTWTMEKVDTIADGAWQDWTAFRSHVTLDGKGVPHIVYEDGGAIKHAYREGDRWRIQLIVAAGSSTHRFSSFTRDLNDTLYIAYWDEISKSLLVAVGHSVAAATTQAEKKAAQ